MSAIMRKPSHLVSKTHSGSSNGASVRVASIGCRRFGSFWTRVIGLRARFQDVAEGEGVAKGVDGRNAVLPFAARWPAQKVDRAWLNRRIDAVPPRLLFAPEPECARGEEGNPHHVTKYRPILMPADRGARAVLSHQNLLEIGRRDARERRCLLADHHQECRH